MLTRRATFVRGLLAGMSIMLSAQAIHWLLTPMSHPGSSPFRHGAVIVQLAAGVLYAIWLARGIPGEPVLPAEPERLVPGSAPPPANWAYQPVRERLKER